MPDKQEFSLYNGEVVLTFAEKSHRYKVSDSGEKAVHCPSVTTILNVLNKPALVEWGVKCACNYVEDNLKLLVAGNSFSVEQIFKIVEQARTAHDRTRQEAADIGTSVHDWLSVYWKNGMSSGCWQPQNLPEEQKAKNCVEAALNWFKEHSLTPVKIEDAQYSRKLKICGRPDFIGYIDGTLSVLDYKSTRSIYPEVALQMTAYGYMHEEEFGENPSTRWALRLDKETGEFEARKYEPETFNLDWETFRACFLLYDRLKHLRRVPKKEPEDFLKGL
jgi:hypothetical protein